MTEQFRIGKDDNGNFKMPPNGKTLKIIQLPKGQIIGKDCYRVGEICGEEVGDCQPEQAGVIPSHGSECFVRIDMFICRQFLFERFCVKQSERYNNCGYWDSTSQMCVAGNPITFMEIP